MQMKSPFIGLFYLLMIKFQEIIVDTLKKFQTKIGYSFYDINLLKLALMHSSYGNEIFRDRKHNNERLEFLGDAVLELAVSKVLYDKYNDLPEGELTKIRASIVCEPTLALCARNIGLDKMILLGKGEEMTGGRFRDSIISDAFEALIGAIYRDGGIECATGFINEFVMNDIDNKKLFVDSKSVLQERLQSVFKAGPTYVVVGEEGPDHCKIFHVEARYEDKVLGRGEGSTKKGAEQKAAYDAIINMQKHNNT